MITVAICTWKRPRLLEQTLDRFCILRVPAAHRWQIVVVDNNSQDETPDVVRSFSTRLPIRYFCETTAGAAAARNRALEESSGARYILFTDDDVLVDPGWLEAAVGYLDATPRAGGVAGPIKPWFPEPPSPELLDVFPVLQIGFCGIDEAQFRQNGCTSYTANLGFRMSSIEGLRFAEHLGPKSGFAGGGEDVAFCRALLARGHLIGWEPAMAVNHYVDPTRMTVPYLLRWHSDDARRMVRVSARPEGRTLFGVPPWAVKLWATSTLKHLWLSVNGQRHLALRHRRARAYWEGTIIEYYQQRRA